MKVSTLGKPALIVALAWPWFSPAPPADAAVASARNAPAREGTRAATEAPPPGASLVVRLSGGLLSVKASDAKFVELLNEVSRQADFVVLSSLPAQRRVSLAFDALPLQDALLAIVKDQNFMLQWQDSRPGALLPRTLWILPNADDRRAAGAAGHAAERERVAVDAQPAQWLRQLGNGPPEVREQFVADLGRRRDARAVAPLARALADSDSEVRRAAIEALAEIGGAQAASALAVALRDNEARIREAAVDALGDIGGPISIALLKSALGDVTAFVRHAAAETLEAMQTSPR